MEDLFCGWRLARLSAALIDVICLNRGTTLAIVLSMLLMRHERQRKAAAGLAPAKSASGTVIDRSAGSDAVVVACA